MGMNAQTTVVNVALGQEYDVYIGRGRGGTWGNKFSHKSGTLAEFRMPTREMAVLAHRRWLWAEIKAGRVTLEQLAELHGKRLGCWCKPQSCHGDTLAAAADWAYSQLNREEQ